ncbi:adhesion G protein-coupled receptor E1-like isoform X1 [Mytilus californianus]|uniref:adhesion G protein-coupled receptor E1-like isoform X1 n=1 Tax=Mytilus californianus TaxID=6549 RepID=UPI0022485EAD|nr:adhesion G protein-coupled receptor E1-like isoform X1 [Mytilus californianus]
MDHLKVKVTGVWILITIFCTLSVEGATYGQHCTTSANCTETGNICGSNKNCNCSSTTFRKNSAECAAKIVLNAVCEVGESADQCVDSLAECRNETGYKCLCKDNNFENKTGLCAPQIVLNAICEVGESADQCVDSLAECRNETGYKCLCKDNNFKDKTGLCAPRIAFNETCDNTDSAADQCSHANMTCLNDGLGIYKCLCNSNYYESGGTCFDRKKPYEACGVGQCVVHATCIVNCTCDMGYEASPVVTPTQCNGAGRETVPILYILAMAKVLSQMLISP